MSPPRMAAFLLALLIAIPLTYFWPHWHYDYVAPTPIPNFKEEFQETRKEDPPITVIIKTVKIEKIKDRIPLEIPPILDVVKSKPSPKEEVEEPERNVCEESGGYKVTNRRSWHCVYPHRHHHYHHRHHHRR